MNTKAIAFVVTVLCLPAILHSDERALVGSNYTESLKQKDEEIAKLQKELIEKSKLIQQQSEKIESLKGLCQKLGVNTSPYSEELLERIDLINKPIYGVRLGEDITELAKRRSVDFAQDIGPWKTYLVKSESPSVMDLSLTTIEDKIVSISVFPTDISLENCNAILEEIKTIYPAVKEGPTSVDRRHSLVVYLDHNKQNTIDVFVEHKERSMEDVSLMINYSHPKSSPD